ncbi:hypothetical protein G6F66_014913 [Rhizopus arrhizus]|nr:hypothetical protein G6F66_014913 [Rhizopus arrhizus]
MRTRWPSRRSNRQWLPCASSMRSIGQDCGFGSALTPAGSSPPNTYFRPLLKRTSHCPRRRSRRAPSTKSRMAPASPSAGGNSGKNAAWSGPDNHTLPSSSSSRRMSAGVCQPAPHRPGSPARREP